MAGKNTSVHRTRPFRSRYLKFLIAAGAIIRGKAINRETTIIRGNNAEREIAGPTLKVFT